jgi:hypothetical protein
MNVQLKREETTISIDMERTGSPEGPFCVTVHVENDPSGDSAWIDGAMYHMPNPSAARTIVSQLEKRFRMQGWQ